MAVFPKYSELQPIILHAFTVPPKVIFGAILENGNIGTLKKNWLRTFQNVMKLPNVVPETNYFCTKEYSALHKFFNTINYTSQATK